MSGDLSVDLPPGCDPALNSIQASAYLGLAVKTLESLRTRGGGPRFIRYGRKAVRYRKSDLDAYMAERAVFSTSERIAA